MHRTDAAYCYRRRSSHVSWSVCLSVCLCVGHTGNPCKTPETITIRSCAAAMRPRVRITLTTCFDYITRSSPVGSADLRKLCENVISKLLCLTGPQSAVWPFRHGLTTFSATIFFTIICLLKSLASLPPPPYDSTSALHGATFQQPTTTLGL